MNYISYDPDARRFKITENEYNYVHVDGEPISFEGNGGTLCDQLNWWLAESRKFAPINLYVFHCSKCGIYHGHSEHQLNTVDEVICPKCGTICLVIVY